MNQIYPFNMWKKLEHSLNNVRDDCVILKCVFKWFSLEFLGDITSCFITVRDHREPYSLRAVARTRFRDGPTREMAENKCTLV